MPSLQDALTEAFDAEEAGTLESPTETSIESTADPIADAGRDERGRFAAKASEQAAEVLEAVAPVETRKPPQSWAKEQWDRWSKLDRETQEYIDKREADFARGISTYKSQWDQAAPLYQAIQPFLPELQQNNIRPDQWIANLGNAHRTLAMGSPEQKAQMFAKLATDYGVNLSALQSGSVDPQFGQLAQTVSQMQNRIEAYQREQEMAVQAKIYQDIDAFQKNAPHFEAVRETMAQLLQSGVAPNLQTAYDKAIRLHDDIWQQHQAEQAKAQAAQRQSQLAQKKAAAVSPRSASPTGITTQGNAKKGLRDLLSDNFDSVAVGRF